MLCWAAKEAAEAQALAVRCAWGEVWVGVVRRVRSAVQRAAAFVSIRLRWSVLGGREAITAGPAPWASARAGQCSGVCDRHGWRATCGTIPKAPPIQRAQPILCVRAPHPAPPLRRAPNRLRQALPSTSLRQGPRRLTAGYRVPRGPPHCAPPPPPPAPTATLDFRGSLQAKHPSYPTASARSFEALSPYATLDTHPSRPRLLEATSASRNPKSHSISTVFKHLHKYTSSQS